MKMKRVTFVIAYSIIQLKKIKYFESRNEAKE